MNKENYITGMTPNILAKADPSAVPPVSLAARPSDPTTEITLANARKYVTAEMSLQLYGPVRESVFEARKAQCVGCEHRFDSDKIGDSIGFCRGCGCGVNQRARLSVKLTMPEAECPKKKWGKAPGRHARLKDRVKAWIIERLL